MVRIRYESARCACLSFVAICPFEEDCATEALTFLLQGCPEAREALRDYVGRLFQVGLSPQLNYRSQVSDVETGRPDVVGTDPTGVDQLVIEAKFWAGLTEKQPGGYVKRLGVGQPGVVLVLAPAARLLTLWPELLANLAAYSGEPVTPPTMSQAATSSCCHLVMSLPCGAGARC